MRRIVVDDCWGTRWTLRVHRDRHVPLDAEAARRRREPELRAQLAAVLAPTPQPRSPAVQGPLPGVRGSRADRQEAAAVAKQAVLGGGPLTVAIAILKGLGTMPADHSRAWVVELQARGRIRRGATWRVDGPEEGVRVATTAADAVRTGLVPQPDGAQLIDVVDERLTVYGAPR
jgi:hypothetical protein